MELQKVKYLVEDGIGTVILDYAANLNAIDEKIAEEILYALEEFEKDSNVKVIIIKGGAKAFSAGGDVKYFYELIEQGDDVDISNLLNMVARITLNMKKSSKMIITSVQGVAAGAGANIALSGDFIVCSDNAKFIQAFVNIGLVPDTGGTYLLSRTIGVQKTMEYCALGKPMTSSEAKDLKLVYDVVPAEYLDEFVTKLAKKLALGPLIAYKNLKKQIFEVEFKDYEDYLMKVEVKTQNDCVGTEDFKEGVKAFIEKRKANFQGK